MTRLKDIAVRVPTWPEYERNVTKLLDVEPGESAEFRAGPVNLELPEVLWLDYEQAAQKLGWSLGQFIGFLAIQGASALAVPTAPPRYPDSPYCGRS